MILKFKIHGNESDIRGHPRSKLKMTGKQSWTDKAQDYVRWKAYVVDCLLEAYKGKEEYKKLLNDVARTGWPIGKSKGKMEMNIMIYFCNLVHGDPENIFGSIADSLFKQDKYLKGSFDFDYKQGSPLVEVAINTEI